MRFPAAGKGPADPRLAQMKRIALALLVAAASLYTLATVRQAAHPAWGWIAAFSEAAMVGAIADWFAVVALFRHPLGLPVPHTAIIPANKDRIGARLADFICDHFLAAPQVLARLAGFDAGRWLAQGLARPQVAAQIGRFATAAGRQVLKAFDDARVRAFLGQLATRALSQVDLARLFGQMLQTLTAERRHQALLDALLAELARRVRGDAVQEHVTDVVAREIKALRYVGLDQVAARAATRRIVAATARTLHDLAADPEHPLRARFDQLVHRLIEQLQYDQTLRARIEKIRTELLARPVLAAYLDDLWSELLAWLHDDLDREDSATRQRIAEMSLALGKHLAGDDGMRHWINEQVRGAAPQALERHREDIRRYIVDTVRQWDARETSALLEQHIGRDLQFIRINGTLVGGLVGLVIHAVTTWAT